jgi:hypothetical protein
MYSLKTFSDRERMAPRIVRIGVIKKQSFVEAAA